MARSKDVPLVRFEPRTPTQSKASQLYAHCDLLLLLGPAGCGKTVTAVGLAASDVVNPLSPRKKVVVLRPAVEADRTLGFLPGTLQEKLQPWKAPILHSLSKVSFRFPEELITFESLGYSRGVTWEDCVIVVDEAQNCSWKQLQLVLTRLGKNSKMVLCGDPEQADVASTGDYECDLEELADALDGTPGVGVVDFPEGESLRHPLLKRLLPKLRRRG